MKLLSRLLATVSPKTVSKVYGVLVDTLVYLVLNAKKLHGAFQRFVKHKFPRKNEHFNFAYEKSTLDVFMSTDCKVIINSIYIINLIFFRTTQKQIKTLKSLKNPTHYHKIGSYSEKKSQPFYHFKATELDM